MRNCLIVIFILSHFFSLNAFASNQNLSQLERLQNQGAKVSALIINLSTKKTIAELSPNLRLSPASVSKLVIGADALETWGPSKTFSSQILMRGVLKNNVLNGDLVFYGAGDPYLTNEKLWFLTSDVARYGITKVTGKIIVNKSLFGNVDEDENRNHGRSHSKSAYDAPLSSSAVNFSVLAIVVSPAQSSGHAARVSLEPYNLPSVKIINNVTTIPSGPSKIFAERDSINNVDTFTVSGNIAVNSPQIRVYRSIANPDQYAGEVLNAFLNHNGVQTSGNIAIENRPLKATDKPVSQVQSFPLNWQLRGLFEMSNNFIADMLTLNLGLENHDPNESNFLQSSAKNLENYMQNLNTNSNHVDNPLVLHSGSGLTPENRLSAKDVIALLARMYSKANLFPEFLSALATPGAEGTLKNRFKKINSTKSELVFEKELMLRAKTGTLTEPLDVVSLAGYSRLKNGDWIALALIVNGSAKNSSFSVANIRSAMDSDLLEILTEK